MFLMRDFGTGLPNDSVFEYRTRITHLQLNVVQKSTKSVKIEEVVRVAYSDHGVTCYAALAGSERRLHKVEHFDLWYCENGPEALMQFIETREEGSKLAQSWKFRPFLEAVRGYLNGAFRVIPSTEVLGKFVVRADIVGQ